MIKTPLINSLFDRMDARLVRHEFVFKKTERAFYRMYDWGRQAIQLGPVTHRDDFDVIVYAGVRFDALEEIVKCDWTHLSPAELKKTGSFGVELGNLLRVGQKRWKIRMESEIDGAVSSIYNEIVQHMLPYLKRFSDMRSAMELLAGDDRDAWIHCPFHDTRARCAVGLAWLLGDIPRMQALIRAKTDYLRGREDEDLQKFESWIVWLAGRTQRPP